MSAPTSSFPSTVAQRLAGTPSVADVILNAASAARAQSRFQAGERGEGMASAMTHAWVFSGPPGAGRSIAALNFAAALLCTDPTEVGCGHCEGCAKTFAGAHADLVHIVPAELSITIAEVRTIRTEANKLPVAGAWRVIIIEDADRLGDAAADALLKTVEEPPERTVIIMCTPTIDPEDFSPTLRSRCRHLYIPAPSVEEITRLLMREEGAAEEHARLAAVTSLRHVGRARRLLIDETAQRRRATILNLAELVFHRDTAFKASGSFVREVEKQAVAALAEENATELAELERALGKGGRGKGTQKALEGSAAEIKELEARQKKRKTRRVRDLLDLALVDLSGIYRDALITGSGAQVGLTHPDFAGLSADLAAKVAPAQLVACLDAISQAREYLGFAVTPVIAFDGMVGKLRLACGVD